MIGLIVEAGWPVDLRVADDATGQHAAAERHEHARADDGGLEAVGRL